jgi:hypothetical protein
MAVGLAGVRDEAGEVAMRGGVHHHTVLLGTVAPGDKDGFVGCELCEEGAEVTPVKSRDVNLAPVVPEAA